MEEFRYLNYYTVYSCKGSIHKKTLNRSACFAEVFSHVKDCSDIYYKVILYKGISKCKYGNNNACLITVEELRNHLRRLRNIYSIHYRVLIKNERFVVFLHLKNVPSTFHKYVLTWLRYAYEYPYNVILKDLYILRQNHEFKFVSTANLFNILASSFPTFVNDIHSVSEHEIHYPLEVKTLRYRIESNKYLCNIYEQKYIKNKDKIPGKIDNYSIYDIEYWNNKEYFKEYREPIYISMYNKIMKE